MKKLISILTTISLIGSSVTTVASCEKNNSAKRFKTAVIDEELRQKILMKLVAEDDFSNTYGKTFNDIANKEKVVEQILQDIISKLANSYFQNKHINVQLGLEEKSAKFYADDISNIAGDIAQNSFYNQYTENIINNPAVSKDEELSYGGEGKNLYSLNPTDLMTNDNKTGTEFLDKNKYFIYFNTDDDTVWKRWQFSLENSTSSVDQLPTINDLQEGQFIIVKANKKTEAKIKGGDLDLSNIFFKNENGEPVDAKNPDGIAVYSIDGQNSFRMNGKTALEYRFQNYFKSQIKNSDEDNKNFYKPMFAMSYLNSTTFKTSSSSASETRKDNFLNISSDLAKTVQTWNKSDNYKSKIKLVWSFTMKNNDVKKARETLMSGGILNNDGTIFDNNKQTLEGLYKLLESKVTKNSSNLGTDPFFNLNGYNGMVKVEGDTISSIDGTGVLSVNDSAKKMIANTNGPAILSKDLKGSGFESNKNGEFDYIFVMPLYLVDLLNDKTSDTIFDYGQASTSFLALDDFKNGEFETLYKSYGQSKDKSAFNLVHSTKVADIKTQKKDVENLYIYVNGAPYSLREFNSWFGQKINQENIWKDLPGLKIPEKTINGIQFTTKNSHDNVYGNIGIDQWVFVAANLKKPDKTVEGIEFEEKDGGLYVKVTKNLVGTVEDFKSFKLSFDSGEKDGLITTTGTLKKANDKKLNGHTYSYKVNMGQNSSDPNGYIESDGFDFYQKNISSLDIANLSSNKKISLLRQLQFIAAKDSSVYERSAGIIYPLFINDESILFEKLYENLKKYVNNEKEKGTSD